MRISILILPLFLALGACSSTGSSPDMAELQRYDAVLVEPVKVSFSEDWEPLMPNSRLPLGDKELERLRIRVGDIFNERFKASLARHGVEVVDTAGEGVLRITPVLSDVVISAPNPEAAFGSIFIRNVGHMSLRADFADAMSGESLVVLQDDVKGRQAGLLTRATRQYNEARLAQLFEQWADIVAEDMLPRQASR